MMEENMREKMHIGMTGSLCCTGKGDDRTLKTNYNFKKGKKDNSDPQLNLGLERKKEQL